MGSIPVTSSSLKSSALSGMLIGELTSEESGAIELALEQKAARNSALASASNASKLSQFDFTDDATMPVKSATPQRTTRSSQRAGLSTSASVNGGPTHLPNGHSSPTQRSLRRSQRRRYQVGQIESSEDE